MKNSNLDLASVKKSAAAWALKARRYAGFYFFLLLAVLYGFILLRINTLSSAQPSEDAVANAAHSARVPRIDPTVINQLKTLQDNSVNVQALFNQTRSNPFQE